MTAPPIPAVQTHGLTRMYGNIAALFGLDLTVNKGDLFGFIGSNGAGKTTTLRILATFLAPSAGTAQILGHDVVRDADAVRHVIGYMPHCISVAHNVVTQDLRGSGGRSKESSQNSECGGLAGSVRANKPKQISFVYGQIQPEQSGDVPIHAG